MRLTVTIIESNGEVKIYDSKQFNIVCWDNDSVRVTAMIAPTKDIRIDELKLSVRSENCLKKNGIFTIGALCEKSEEEVMRFRNLGKRAYYEIVEALHSFGYRLKGEN